MSHCFAIQTQKFARSLLSVSIVFPPAVPAWIDLLVDKDDSLRERAAISLGVIGDPAAVDALTSVLLNDPNSDVRQQAARSLGLIAAGTYPESERFDVLNVCECLDCAFSDDFRPFRAVIFSSPAFLDVRMMRFNMNLEPIYVSPQAIRMSI